MLTHKESAVDEKSGSKPEHETRARTPRQRTPSCEVGVSEIDGTFLEVETLVEDSALGSSLDGIRVGLEEPGVGVQDLTRETYAGTVAAQRR